MAAFFTMLFAKIAGAVAWFGSLFIAVFVAGWDMFRDVCAWVFEQLMSIAVTAVSSLDTGAIPGASSFGAIPADVGNVLSVLGVGTAITMITAALAIRFILQLIPFVRLGS